jgi:superfamily II DNA or RNA helicase
MQSLNKTLYQLIKNKVSSKHLQQILGGALYNGLVNYQSQYSITQFDNAELLIRGLGMQSVFNREFQNFIIRFVFLDQQIVEFSNLLKIQYVSNIITRENILKKSKKKLGMGLIEYLNLNIDEFVEVDLDLDIVKQDILIQPDKSKYLSLHDYQKQIKDRIVLNLLDQIHPNRRMLVHMPTGSGKTKTCMEAIVDFLRTRPFNEGLVLWFANSTELCNQSYETLVSTWQNKGDYDLPVFKIFGENDANVDIFNFKKAVIFIGFQKFQSILKSKKDFDIKIRKHISTNTQLVVIDEAHKSLAKTYEKAINYVSNMPNCRVIGLTATPGRSSNINDLSNKFLSDYFSNNIIKIEDEFGQSLENPLEYLQKHKILANIDHNPIKVNFDDFTDDEVVKIIESGELDESQIEKVVESPIRNKIIVDEVVKSLKNPARDLILIFACSTSHCILIQKLLELNQVKSEVVLAETPTRLRNRYISDFKKGELKVLINFGVLTTGFDAPRLKTLILARHTSSIILYSQMVGRALRGPRNGGNEINYVVDLVDNFTKLGNPDQLFTYWEDFWGKKLEVN